MKPDTRPINARNKPNFIPFEPNTEEMPPES